MSTVLATLLIGLATSTPGVAADELCLTGNARRNQNLPIACTVQPESASVLLDGSHHDQRSINWRSTDPISLQFAEPVRVSRVELVVYNDRERSYNAAGRMRVRLLSGEAPVTETEWASLDQDATLLCGTDDQVVWGSKSELRVDASGPADRLEVTVEKLPGAVQCLLRELHVWGIPERLIESANGPGAAVQFRATDNTYSSLRVTWDAVPPGTEYVRVKHRRRGERGWRSACFAASPGLVFWLRPEAEYEVCVEAVGEALRGSQGRAEVVRLPHPLEVRSMGDLWGMNFYPGGGGAHETHENETANTRRMIQLMRMAGVRHVRWFSAAPAGANLFGEAGMSDFPFAAHLEPEAYGDLAHNRGVWLAATRNEPDFADILAEDFCREQLPRTAAAEAFDPLMLLAGPAIGGELVGPGSDYLRDCYRAGLKDAVHAMDLHPYTKVATPTPPGCILGGPESILHSLQACREVMAEFGDAGRPIIVSETGHPTHEGFWWMPPSSFERQAQFIVRNHLLLAASGVRRIFWYAFQDEGTDRRNPEHNFGIVDWHGERKPAYRSYSVMLRVLGRATNPCLESLRSPAYGVRCALAGEYVTALWDGGGEGELRIDAACGIRKTVGLMGDALAVPEARDEALTLPISEDVRYVFSREPLRYLAQRRIAPPVAPQIQMSLAQTTIRARPGDTMGWEVHLRSEFDCPVDCVVGCANPWGGPEPRREVTLAPHGEVRFSLSVNVPADAKPKIHSWDNRCQYDPKDGQWEDGDFRRAVFFIVE